MQKNNSAQVGQNFQNQLPDHLSGIKQTSDQVGRRSVFYSRQVVGKLVLKILSNLGRIIFLHFFFEVVLKMPFSAATTWREKLLRSLPKTQIPSATT